MPSDKAGSMKRPIRVAELASSDIQPSVGNAAFTHFWKSSTRFQKLVIGSFPFLAYGCWHIINQKKQRHNFELHQSRIFKETISLIGSSSLVRDTYGENMQLKCASIWTAGYMPWLEEKYIWIGFSGNKLDGWIRMGIRRSDFETSKEIVSGIKNDVDAEIEADKIKAYEMREGFEYLKDSRDSAELEHLRQKTTSPPTKTAPESVQPTVLSSEGAEGDKMGAEGDTMGAEGDKMGAEGDTMGAEGDKMDISEKRYRQKIGDLLESDLPEAEKNKLTAKATVQLRKELKEKYPTIPTNFTNTDIEQAMKIEKQHKTVVTVFNKIWYLSTVSIHPLDLSKKEDVFVIYNPDNNYHDQDQYLFDSSFFSIRKPLWMARTKEVTNT